MSQSSTSRLIISDLSEENAAVINDAAEQMMNICHDAMQFRISAFDTSLSVSLREELMMTEMITAVNNAAQVEEKMISLMSMKQVLDSLWGELESEALANPQMKYVDKKGKVSVVIKSHREIWNAKVRVDGAIEAAKRVVERLTAMQWAARAASGSSRMML